MIPGTHLGTETILNNC